MDEEDLKTVCEARKINCNIKQKTTDNRAADDMAEVEMEPLMTNQTDRKTIEQNQKKQEPYPISVENDNDMEEGEVEDSSSPTKELGEVRTFVVLNDVTLPAHEVKEVTVKPTEQIKNATKEIPLFEIHFRNTTVFKRYGFSIMGAVQQALNTEEERVELTVMNEKGGDGMIICAFGTDKNLSVPVTNSTTSEVATKAGPPDREQSPDFTGLSELFMIDTEPAKTLDAAKVPSYKRAIKDALDELTAKRKKIVSNDICTRPRPTSSCFNCGGTGHAMRDCAKPRSSKRINRAMKAFSTKQERYHVDIEQRFGHVQVGNISDKLKHALGLRRGEMPFFFYRMRLLGYPPGWLEEAKVASSGISLFSSEGVEVLKSDEDEFDPINYRIDISKIHEFPGFNTYPEGNFFDDFIQHNVPPMTAKDMKDQFIKSLGDRVTKGYKRKKLKDLPGAHHKENQSTTTLQVTDMDIEDPAVPPNETIVTFTRPPPPVTEPPSLPPPPASSATSVSSPSLVDLEAEQQKLKDLLSVDNSNSNDSSSEKAVALADGDTKIADSATKQDDKQGTSQLRLRPSSPASPSTPASGKSNSTIIKESHMGTPVLQFSPFEKLPAGDNFKIGVSDVINFENLPDSTGKYEQMKVVIKKVRHQITQLQNEDE